MRNDVILNLHFEKTTQREINKECLLKFLPLNTNLIDPLQQGTAALGGDGVALLRVLVPVRGLHVGEDVRGRLVERVHLGRGAVGELDVAQVALGALDVLRRSHQVVPRLRRDGVPALEVP